MSLINDALKRAKQAEAQRSAQTTPGPRLQPVEPVPEGKRISNLLMPGLAVAFIGVTLFLAWRVLHTGGSVQPVVAAQPAAGTATTIAVAPPTPAQQVPPTLEAKPNAQSSSPLPAPNASVESAPASSPTPSQAAPVAEVSPPSVTPLALTEKPAPLRLQGILYRPGHPAAMIGGKMVFIGDKLGEWRVSAIDQESATLIAAGQTNILTLTQ
jgi:hypothetical protein